MIFKVMTRKGKNIGFKQLASYIMQKKENLIGDDSFSYLHNVSGNDAHTISKAFRENNKKHLKKRNGAVKLYHIMMSFHPKDKKFIDNKVLEAVTKKFVSLRSDGMYFIRAHFEKENVHLHIMGSATGFASNTSMRMSKKELQTLQKELNLFQLEKFPALRHSVHYLTAKERGKINLPKPFKLSAKDGEVHLQKRGRKTMKEVLQKRLFQLGKGKTEQAFLAAIEKEKDLSLYQYRNKINGVVFQGKKYRFRTLGIDVKNIQKQVKLQQLNEKGKVLKQKELSVLQPKR